LLGPEWMPDNAPQRLWLEGEVCVLVEIRVGFQQQRRLVQTCRYGLGQG
jgi:hypothetical protein